MRRERCLRQNTGDKGVKQKSDEDGEEMESEQAQR